MWLLLLTAVNISNPTDIPASVTLELSSQHECEQTLKTMTFWVKFKSFKITGQCKQK